MASISSCMLYVTSFGIIRTSTVAVVDLIRFERAFSTIPTLP